MYAAVLALHSWVRWLVLILAILAVARAIMGTSGRRPWKSADENAGRFLTIALDVQFLVGLILYVALSPFTRAAFENMGAAMANRDLRFWVVEHVFGMIAALVLAHIGRSRIRKAGSDHARHRTAAIFYTLALLAMLASTPWPGLPNGRPLFRGL